MITLLTSLGIAHVVADTIAFVFFTKNIMKAGDTLLSNAKKMGKKEEEVSAEPKRKEKSFKDYRKY